MSIGMDLSSLQDYLSYHASYVLRLTPIAPGLYLTTLSLLFLLSGDYQFLDFIKIYPLFRLPKIIIILHS